MKAVIERFDKNQLRDPDGTWGDGIPGPDASDFDLGGFDLVSDIDGSFGNAVMGVDESGDVRLAFREGRDNREIDLGGDEFHELGNALQRLADARDDLGEDAETGEVQDEYGFGDGHKAELFGNGVISVVFGASDPDPWTLNLDPPDGEDDDAQLLLDAMDDVFNELDAMRSRVGGRRVSDLRAVIERKFDPLKHPHDPGGEGGGQFVTAGGGMKDALKLAGKIDLAPDETLLSSAKIDGDGGIRMALTEQGGKRMLRLGLGAENYGKANREEGISAWSGSPPGPALSKAEHDRLDEKFDALDAEYDSASPDRQEEITALQEQIREQLGAGDEEFNGGTAKLDEYSMARLAAKLRPAIAEAVEQEKAENKAWDELQALEAKGNPDPARMAELRQIVDRTDYIVFDEGIIPGSEWGDVHYSVELDDPTVGPTINLGVKPKGAPDDWESGRDWQGQFDPAEIRKFLRLLEKMSADAQRSRSPEQGSSPAPPAGGQFALGGGRVGGKAKSQPTRRKKGSTKSAPGKPAAPGPMSFDGKHGTGYGIKGGDPRVRTLQAALNRLGLTDSSGAGLAVDGKYGPRTTSSVKKLQKSLGLPADGKVTPALLKQATELKQLPPKTTTPRKPRSKTSRVSATKRSRILAQVARALGECYLVDGICIACTPPLDDASRALLEAFEEIERARHVRTAAGVKKYGLPIGSVIGGGSGPHVPPVHAPHVPTASVAPKAARKTVKDRLVSAIDDHLKGNGNGDPLADFSRPQLVKVAKERGVALDRGEHRDAIAKKLLDHARGDSRPGLKPDSSLARPKRAAGRDISGDVDYKSLPASYNPKTGENDALKAVIHNQGFDGKPQVVSAADFDAALGRGEVRETWRGLAAPVGKKAPDLAEQYRTGDFYVGLGINGDGTYVATSKADGQYYGSTLLRIGLHKDAKVISADDLDAEMDAFFATQAARRRSAELKRLDDKLLKDLAGARTSRDRANIRRRYRNTVDGLDPDRSIALQRDPGVFAALRGYDAIEIPKERSPDKHHEMILLNRAATIVQEA